MSDSLSDPYEWLKMLHVCANVLWIGAIFAVGYFAGTRIGDVGPRLALALRLYRRIATPAFIVSFICGALVLAARPYLFSQHWMHGKLLFALIVIVIHHLIGARVRQGYQGAHQRTRPVKTLAGLLAVAAFVTVFFAILHPM